MPDTLPPSVNDEVELIEDIAGGALPKGLQGRVIAIETDPYEAYVVAFDAGDVNWRGPEPVVETLTADQFTVVYRAGKA